MLLHLTCSSVAFCLLLAIQLLLHQMEDHSDQAGMKSESCSPKVLWIED